MMADHLIWYKKDSCGTCMYSQRIFGFYSCCIKDEWVNPRDIDTCYRGRYKLFIRKLMEEMFND
jgi:hypothetical protein